MVALSAGMSKSGVFAHFGSKEQLQLALERLFASYRSNAPGATG
jgi:AcrR family transcriptional regulator